MKIIQNKLVEENNKQIRIGRMDILNSLRKEWLLNPATKVKKSAKIYNRKKINKIIERDL